MVIKLENYLIGMYNGMTVNRIINAIKKEVFEECDLSKVGKVFVKDVSNCGNYWYMEVLDKDGEFLSEDVTIHISTITWKPDQEVEYFEFIIEDGR